MSKINMPKIKTVKKRQNDEEFIDSALRPTSWNDYIGQEKIKKVLALILAAARKRKESVDHLLFYGPAGLGKTTLANLAAKEMGANLKTATGTALQKLGDLAAVLSNLENGDVLFIDEVHRIPRAIEEILYPAMEARKLCLMIGKGLASRIVSIDLPAFTLIAATTRPSLLSNPLRSRFGGIFHFDYYDSGEIETIIKRSANLMGLNMDSGAILALAEASRFTPRTANRLLKRARDFSEVNNLEIIDAEVIKKTLKFFEVDELGLEICERNFLKAIIVKFHNRPVGINVLTSFLGEERGTIEEIYEPYLMKIGFLQRTPQGRIATQEAYKHLGL
ncbi:Holliday junction branch migration DNA helicase RuvB [Candidatus Wolfebacteria bacterium]|nr:Holliday junction branch migration DNA helicase RuvB [Candidatus Wolfebacteria bacterium]